VSSFPEAVEAVLLAGGVFEDLPPGEEAPKGKGLLPIAGLPMAARALRALKCSPAISRVIMVSPVAQHELTDPCWDAVDVVVPAGGRLIDSFKVGLEAVLDPSEPAMVVAGDLPLLTAESVTDFVDRCRARQEVQVWYGCLRKSNSEAAFPGVHHTYAKLSEGVFCGAGLFLSRPQALASLYQALTSLTYARKNPLKLAKLLGWEIIVSFLLGRLTIPQAERGMSRLLGGTLCAGIETPYPETAFNVDDLETLEEARRYLEAT
jgi:GTP:adenosylcobinamide-phosphate guanylyltransferase